MTINQNEQYKVSKEILALVKIVENEMIYAIEKELEHIYTYTYTHIYIYIYIYIWRK